jgi:hypothetical protein
MGICDIWSIDPPAGLHCEFLNFDLNADPDPALHSNANQDPALHQSDGNLAYKDPPGSILSLQAFIVSFRILTIMQIRIQLFTLIADPDPAPYLSDGNLRHLGYRSYRAPL